MRGPQGGTSSYRASDIPAALQEFERRCSRLTTTGIPAFSLRDDELQRLVNSAGGLVQGVLSGIHGHLGDKLGRVDAEVSAVSPGTPQDLLSISVKLEPRVFGELATRSRVAVSVHVDKDIKFVLQAPSCSSDSRLLTLRVQGLNLPALPEAVEIRRRLRDRLGSEMQPLAAYRWWRGNHDTECPVDKSKFRWVVESLLEQRGMKLLGEKTNYEAFWGYLHTTDLNLARFEFLLDRRGDVELRANLNEPKDDQEARDRKIVKDITMGQLKANRKSGEKLASSAINVAAMLFGPAVGQPGARAEVITKMLSGAKWWGPGQDGWHRYDKTWECTDRKDMLGRVIESQGRIIWHTEGHTTTAPPTWQLEAADDRSPMAAPTIALFILSLVMALMVHSRFESFTY